MFCDKNRISTRQDYHFVKEIDREKHTKVGQNVEGERESNKFVEKVEDLFDISQDKLRHQWLTKGKRYPWFMYAWYNCDEIIEDQQELFDEHPDPSQAKKRRLLFPNVKRETLSQALN